VVTVLLTAYGSSNASRLKANASNLFRKIIFLVKKESENA
jgi:hypothetical protein